MQNANKQKDHQAEQTMRIYIRIQSPVFWKLFSEQSSTVGSIIRNLDYPNTALSVYIQVLSNLALRIFCFATMYYFEICPKQKSPPQLSKNIRIKDARCDTLNVIVLETLNAIKTNILKKGSQLHVNR